MLYALLKTVHVLSIMLWVGGMAFAHLFLRPAAAALPPPERLTLLHTVMERFFKFVTWAATLTLVTGIWMIGRTAKVVVQSGGSFAMPLSWTLMATLGVVMIAIFGHIRFALFKRMSRALLAQDWPAGGSAMASIRTWVLVNLVLGVVTVVVALLRV